MTRYAELAVTSNFSFLRGASHAEELVQRAVELGIAAIAVTDSNTLAGVVRAHVAACGKEIQLIVGSRLTLRAGNSLLCWPTDRAAYARLSQLLTLGNRRAPKGECWLDLPDVLAHAEGQLFAAMPGPVLDPSFEPFLLRCRAALGERLSLAAVHYYRGDDRQRLAALADLSARTRVPLLATNDVHYHVPRRRPLQDVLTCVRLGCTIDQAGWRLHANAERHLKGPEEMARLFRDYPEALARGLEISSQCRFRLDELRYEYPHEVTEGGRSPAEELARLAWEGTRNREYFPNGISDKIRQGISHELEMIGQLNYEPYFLTVYDIVRHARSQGILCQGRGSAANSTVCYCLGITSVSPELTELLFERFISTARNEPPDIDVDFEHERREEVMQYIYGKYGRDRAGIVATVIRYRSRSAIGDVGKALGLSADTIKRLSNSIWGWGDEAIDEARAREQGLNPDDPTLRLALDLASELHGFPRHLSQHVGGFVMTRGPLAELCPIMNALMDNRTNIEWDKDDIDALGILKVDVLALGMLTCVHRAFDLIRRYHGRTLTLASLPKEDPAVYEMLSRADSLGVFQVESRAQMTMLPRLRPKTFYDLVIEVAIVRPGPIQGDMVHPYLRRRDGLEKPSHPPGLDEVLKRTLGVPLFQEQAMKIAIVGAGFTPSEADQLRRAMATFKKVGIIDTFREKMVTGMVARGFPEEFAVRCFRQIEGFGTYGFPESHAASFALLVYVSAWIKRHYPAVLCAARRHSPPLGVYAPPPLVRDAREHGIEVRGPDVNASDWDCMLEPAPGGFAVRLGLRQAKDLREGTARTVIARRGNGYPDMHTLWRRTGLTGTELEPLAHADAVRSLDLDRRQALWTVKALEPSPLPLFDSLEGERDDSHLHLPPMRLGEHVAEDYGSLALSLKAHPMQFLREHWRDERQPNRRYPLVTAADLPTLKHHALVSVAGIVLVRQRPDTAKGVMFLTVEDEAGAINLVIFPDLYAANRRTVLTGRALLVEGQLEKADKPGAEIIHVICRSLTDITGQLSVLTEAVDMDLKPRNLAEFGGGKLVPMPRSFH